MLDLVVNNQAGRILHSLTFIFIIMHILLIEIRCDHGEMSSKSSYPSVYSLNKLDLSKYPLARCLDGSAAGFWINYGFGQGQNKFLLHHQSGGWCLNLDDCYKRSLTRLGSSKDWNETMYRRAGLSASDESENPLVYNWNKVFIGYCDGASFSGHIEKPISSTGRNVQLHYKGKFILDAVYETLLFNFNMRNATEIVISGGSAGGLAVYLHIDYLANKIKLHSTTSPKIVGIPDAGYFMDYPSISGVSLYTTHFQNIFHFQNTSHSLNQACIKYYKSKAKSEESSETWKCFMAQYALPFVQTPLFIANSLFDSWQGENIMGFDLSNQRKLQSTIKLYGKEKLVQYLNSFRSNMLESPLGKVISNRGVWLCSCWMHSLTGFGMTESSKGWSEIFVGSSLLNQTHLKLNLKSSFQKWYLNIKESAFYIDNAWGSNSC